MSSKAVSSATFTQLSTRWRREVGEKIARKTGTEIRPALSSAPTALRRFRKLRRPTLASAPVSGTSPESETRSVAVEDKIDSGMEIHDDVYPSSYGT